MSGRAKLSPMTSGVLSHELGEIGWETKTEVYIEPDIAFAMVADCPPGHRDRRVVVVVEHSDDEEREQVAPCTEIGTLSSWPQRSPEEGSGGEEACGEK